MALDRPKNAPPRSDLESQHTPEAVRERLKAGPNHSYLHDFIYGAIDGTVTTFAVVAGVMGAELSAGIIIVLGLANLLGDGFSMAVSNFLGTRAEAALINRTRRSEELHIKQFPEGEREEIRQIFAAKGFQGDELEHVVQVITADDRRWIDTMLSEEHGLPRHLPSAGRAGLSTFAAFVLVGLVPLAAFIINLAWPGLIPSPFIASIGLTGAAFFCVGAIKARFVQERWWLAGLETLVMGGLAAALAYWVGAMLRGFV